MSPETKRFVDKANELARIAREVKASYDRHWAAYTPIHERRRALDDLLLNGDTAVIGEWREAVRMERRFHESADASSERKWNALEAWGKAHHAAVQALIADAALERVEQ